MLKTLILSIRGSFYGRRRLYARGENTYLCGKVNSDKITAEKIEEKLRLSKNPIIVRVSKDEVILDVRTLFERDFNIIVEEFKNY